MQKCTLRGFSNLFIGDKDLYTGLTKDIKLRFDQHNKGLVESTRDRRPFTLIYYEACLDRDDATRREKYVKTSGEDVLEKEAQILFNMVKRF
jgi:putative endonuclease